MYNNRGQFSRYYGADELSVTLIVSGVLLILAYPCFTLFYLRIAFILVGVCLILWALYRAFSSQIGRRRAENDKFIAFFSSTSSEEKKRRKEEEKAKKAKRKQDEKTYAYFFCPKCRKELRVPRGKGKIRIKCPNCCHEFIRKS